MLGNDFFYNGSIKDYVVTFGKLFSDIYVQRTNEDSTTTLTKVPLHFANKRKMYQEVFNKDHDNISYPRMGFSFNVQGVDDDRKTHRLNELDFKTTASTADWSYNAIPYNFTFNLTVYSIDIQDVLQIIEQILPFFQPSLTVKIKPFADYPDFITDVVMILDSSANTFQTEGELREDDVFEWDLSFTLKGWLFNKITVDGPIILDVSNVKLYDQNTGQVNQ